MTEATTDSGSIEAPRDLGGTDPGTEPGSETGSVTDPVTDIVGAAESTEISLSADCITLINVFAVAPENQARLIEELTTATTEVIRLQPGFVSANLHASLDGTRVANYAQWASVDDFQAMLEDPDCRPHLEACSAIAEADPHIYRVSSVHHV